MPRKTRPEDLDWDEIADEPNDKRSSKTKKKPAPKPEPRASMSELLVAPVLLIVTLVICFLLLL